MYIQKCYRNFYRKIPMYEKYKDPRKIKSSRHFSVQGNIYSIKLDVDNFCIFFLQSYTMLS